MREGPPLSSFLPLPPLQALAGRIIETYSPIQRSRGRLKNDPLAGIGLAVFIIAGGVNALFINLSVFGIPRELARLSILSGVLLLAAGLLKRKKSK